MSKYLFLLLLLSNFVNAESKVRISGFGTIGFATTDSKEFGYRADFSKTGGVFENDIDFAESSNLGLQMDIIASDEIDLVVQAVYRDQQDLNLDTVLNLAFLRYAPNANWSLRVGRTAFDLFLLTEYRDIGFAYTWAHVPSEIYGGLPHRYIDGVDLTYRRPLGNVSFSAKLFYGNNESAMTGFSLPNDFKFGMVDVKGLTLDLQSVNWDLAMNHTHANFDNQNTNSLVAGLKQFNELVPNFSAIWPNVLTFADDVDVNNSRGTYTSVSGQYRFDNVTVISELARISTNYLVVHGVESGYLSGIYHYNAHNFFASIAFSETEKFSLDGVNFPALEQLPGGVEIIAGTQYVLNFYNVNQNTLSLGWRWDFDETMSFKIQLDRTQIKDGGSTFWQPPVEQSTTYNRTGHVNALFANVSFLF